MPKRIFLPVVIFGRTRLLIWGTTAVKQKSSSPQDSSASNYSPSNKFKSRGGTIALGRSGVGTFPTGKSARRLGDREQTKLLF
jgi:hypothetical protein